MPRPSFPRRGDVWLVDLDPTVGHEIRKTRPAVIVTSNLYNELNWVYLVIPLTSDDHAEYDQVLIRPREGGLRNPSVSLPDQLRAIDSRRLVRRLGKLSAATMQQLDHTLRLVLDL